MNLFQFNTFDFIPISINHFCRAKLRFDDRIGCVNMDMSVKMEMGLENLDQPAEFLDADTGIIWAVVYPPWRRM